ncbi:MAG TPA: SRPBCC family protein [Steroidobacteraceae bacterium]
MLVVTGLGLLFLASGYAMPRDHQVRVSMRIPAPRSLVWVLVSDTQDMPAWFKEAASVHRVPQEGDHEVWKVDDAAGNSLTYVTVRREAPSLYIRAVRDPSGTFGGTWSINLEAMGNETQVSIEEKGWIAAAPFRPVQRFILGYDTTMKRYLAALSAAASARNNLHGS